MDDQTEKLVSNRADLTEHLPLVEFQARYGLHHTSISLKVSHKFHGQNHQLSMTLLRPQSCADL